MGYDITKRGFDPADYQEAARTGVLQYEAREKRLAEERAARKKGRVVNTKEYQAIVITIDERTHDVGVEWYNTDQMRKFKKEAKKGFTSKGRICNKLYLDEPVNWMTAEHIGRNMKKGIMNILRRMYR